MDPATVERHYGAAERYVRTLPGIRHLIRLAVFLFYDIRFIASAAIQGPRPSAGS